MKDPLLKKSWKFFYVHCNFCLSMGNVHPVLPEIPSGIITLVCATYQGATFTIKIILQHPLWCTIVCNIHTYIYREGDKDIKREKDSLNIYILHAYTSIYVYIYIYIKCMCIYIFSRFHECRSHSQEKRLCKSRGQTLSCCRSLQIRWEL